MNISRVGAFLIWAGIVLMLLGPVTSPTTFWLIVVPIALLVGWWGALGVRK